MDRHVLIFSRIIEYLKVEATNTMKAMEDKAKAINAKAKAQTRKDIREPKAFSKEDLIDGLKKGQSDYSGSTW